MLGRQRGDGHYGDAAGGLELVPAALRHHDHGAAGQVQNFFARVGQNGQAGAAFDDLHQFVAVGMALPRAGTVEAGEEDAALIEGREVGVAFVCLRR